MDYKNEDYEPVVVREPLELYGKSRFTEQEYLEFTAIAEGRYEYYKGEIFKMSGERIPHAKLQTTLTVEIGQHLKGRECNVFGESLKVHIEKNTLYTHPDISIVCYDLLSEELSEDETLTFIKPSAIIEILSPSTRDYDLIDKFRLYKDIPGFQEYILVDTSMVNVIYNKKNEDGSWNVQEFEKLDDILKIKCIEFSISLRDIYAGTRIKEGGRVVTIRKKK